MKPSKNLCTPSKHPKTSFCDDLRPQEIINYEIRTSTKSDVPTEYTEYTNHQSSESKYSTPEFIHDSDKEFTDYETIQSEFVYEGKSQRIEHLAMNSNASKIPGKRPSGVFPSQNREVKKPSNQTNVDSMEMLDKIALHTSMTKEKADAASTTVRSSTIVASTAIKNQTVAANTPIRGSNVVRNKLFARRKLLSNPRVVSSIPIKNSTTVGSTPAGKLTNVGNMSSAEGSTLNPCVKWSLQKDITLREKCPELKIPATITHFGDCLKTRLGSFHYGRTLQDPPCQFFQGVLKGASGQTLAVMFGDVNLLSRLEDVALDEVGDFVMDTTYKVIPNSTAGINYVFTINMLLRNQTMPLWYAVTSCSSPEVYKRIIIEFQQHVLDLPFRSVLLDNDPALCQAVLKVFPDIELYGSWFHYCFSIWREVTINSLAKACKTDSMLLHAVKLLMVIPFLPPVSSKVTCSISILDGFEFVKEFSLENNLPSGFSNVLEYVDAFWITKVGTNNFTVFGNWTRTLNHIEYFQLALLAYMKSGGNIWTLTYSFQSLAKTTSADFKRYINGKRLRGSSFYRGRRFNMHIQNNMKKLLSGLCDIQTFLENSTVYCDEILDLFLHPLYPTTTSEPSNHIHTEGWKIKIFDKSRCFDKK